MSPDVIELSIAHASDDDFEKIANKFMRDAFNARSKNPMSSMF